MIQCGKLKWPGLWGVGVKGAGRRGFLSLLTGLGLGAAAAEVYERLYNMPSLEERFRAEVNYWMGRYESANAELNNLAAQHNAAQKKIEDLTLQVRRLDELEVESTSAISFYRRQVDEAIEGLRNTIEKYRTILGGERVAFETATLKVLEDLKITKEDLRSTNEKLLKLLPYLPLIKDLSWQPSEVVNDKVYSLNVSLEVLSPLNTLKEVEVKLIPVVYPHLPAEAFPAEEVKTVRLRPKGLEREIFSVSFDLKGGREYVIEAVAKDVAGSFNKDKTETPYMREFENIAPLDKVAVVVPYYPWYRRDFSNWKDGHKYTPLLGEYRSDDPVVMSKHIDWATGHGIDVFAVSWTGYEGGDLKYFDDNLKLLFNNTLSQDVKIAILYESPGRFKTTNNPLAPWEKDLSDPENLRILLTDFEYLSQTYFQRENYLKIQNRPFVYMYDSAAFIGDVKTAIEKLRESIEVDGYDVFLVSDHIHPYVMPGDNKEWEARAKSFDGVTSWLGGYSGVGKYLGGSYEAQLEILYFRWGKWVEENQKKLFPYITPEFDGRYVKWGNPNSVPLERSPILFEKRLEIALKHAKTTRVVLIGTWNDFFESTTLEPTREYGFTYLEIIKKEIEKYS